MTAARSLGPAAMRASTAHDGPEFAADCARVPKLECGRPRDEACPPQQQNAWRRAQVILEPLLGRSSPVRAFFHLNLAPNSLEAVHVMPQPRLFPGFIATESDRGQVTASLVRLAWACTDGRRRRRRRPGVFQSVSTLHDPDPNAAFDGGNCRHGVVGTWTGSVDLDARGTKARAALVEGRAGIKEATAPSRPEGDGYTRLDVEGLSEQGCIAGVAQQ
ncbi:hypothetical protein CLCR_07527 [Cladophialophora carrionii]|uniref:Uncharacterized protein n=1 Tax=Cladophialophora carrionii TaxID=86049 RepID=A0A1C1CM63_9EURO|nr:hypothetical protein CLCR_07527 [Cladophialophora carrionii]